MKTLFDIAKDAMMLALETVDLDTLSASRRAVETAEAKGHTGKDFDYFKACFENNRSGMLQAKSKPAPSDPEFKTSTPPPATPPARQVVGVKPQPKKNP